MVGRLLYPYARAAHEDHRFSVSAKTGSTFSGNTADLHAYQFAISGFSEWRSWALALAICEPGDLIVEIGANVGTETVGFSDIVGARGRVVAFEPLPRHLETLRAVIANLRHQNVTLMPFAVSDQESRATFAVPSASMSQGIGHLLGPQEQESGTVSYYDRQADMSLIEVDTRPLDAFAAQLRGIRLLVADAEGSELRILRGARTLLAAERPLLVLEASQPHQRRAGFGIDLLHEEVSGLGYLAYEVRQLSLRQVLDPLGGPPQRNWLCVPREQVSRVRGIQRMLRRCALAPCVLGLNPLTRPARRDRHSPGSSATDP